MIVILALISGQSLAQSYKVIVNKDSSISSLTKDQISKLFLKKVTRFIDGTSALPVDLVSDSSVRQAFSEDIHGQSVASVRKYWQKQIFSGRGVPPAEKTNDQEVIAYIEANPGAIGYVSASVQTGNVKIISVID
jgi:ABC-type phosphate transport system substrate-binding protein